MLRTQLWFAFFVLLILASACYAHSEQESPTRVDILPQVSFLTVRITGNGSDLHDIVQTDAHATAASSELSSAARERATSYFSTHLMLKQGGERLRGTLQSLRLWRTDALDATRSRFEAVYRFERSPSFAKTPLRVTSGLFDMLGKSKTIVSLNGVEKVLDKGETTEFAAELSRQTLAGNALNWLIAGLLHLGGNFELVLLIVAGVLATARLSWLLFIKGMLGFNLAQAIMLTVGILAAWQPSSHILDVAIALSIATIGGISWWVARISEPGRKAGGSLPSVLAVFGLVYGLAAVAPSRANGLPESGLGLCIVAFVLGSCLVQIALSAVAIALVKAVRSKFEHNAKYGGMPWSSALQWGSGAVTVLGVFWTLERLFQ